MNSLSNMRLTKKIVAAAGVVLTLLVGNSILAIWSMSRIKAAQDGARQEALRIYYAKDVQARTVRVVNYLSTVLLHTSGVERRCNTCHEDRPKYLLLAPIDKERETYGKSLQDLHASVYNDEDKRLIDGVEQALSELKGADNRSLELWKASKYADAQQEFQAVSMAKLPAMMSSVDKVVDYRKAQMEINAAATASMISTATWTLIIVVLGSAAIAIPLSMFIARDVARPISNVIEHLDAVSQGDISQDVPASLTARRDEAGDLSKAMQHLMSNLRPMIRKVADGVQTLSSSSTQLSAISGQMSTGSRQTSERADAVGAAAEEMSASMHTLTAEMEQATSNLTSVASATEQMTATIGDIAANSEKARRITGDATHQAAQVSQSVEQLGQAAQRIGQVTETISNISAQTNLLALNATIEAARAGAAGKGFAVVANEIKDLAQQTAKATEDIKDKVLGIQSSTSQTIVDIGSISQTIRDVSEIVSSIATAIEEQAVVTKDIAGNIAEASGRVNSANEQVSQSSRVSSQIAEDIGSVTTAANDTAAGSTEVNSGAQDLSKLAEALRQTVEQFKL